MTQKRLNNVLVCHVHCCILRDISVDDVLNDFITSLNDSCSHLLGKIKTSRLIHNKA